MIARAAWGVMQIVLGVAMLQSLFYLVTGSLAIMALNGLAGVVAIVAGTFWRTSRWPLRLSVTATLLYVPLNLAIFAANLDSPHWVPMTVGVVALLQVAAMVVAARWLAPLGR